MLKAQSRSEWVYVCERGLERNTWLLALNGMRRTQIEICTHTHKLLVRFGIWSRMSIAHPKFVFNIWIVYAPIWNSFQSTATHGCLLRIIFNSICAYISCGQPIQSEINMEMIDFCACCMKMLCFCDNYFRLIHFKRSSQFVVLNQIHSDSGEGNK